MLKKYTPPFQPLPELKRDYTPENWHTIKSKFRFTLTGSFPGDGMSINVELLRMGRFMGLVGWIKCRPRVVSGHIQGDVISMSYVERWLKLRQSKTSKISSVEFTDVNYGIPELKYTKLQSVYDMRKPAKKRKHDQLRVDSNKAKKLMLEAVQHHKRMEQFFE
eukprot:Platyproteum_vivax@DN12074_c0_g1_i1.p1